ncbi:MAG: hypothetical protein AB7S38_30520 [Vulcanimicrobiota bacterium]
MNRWLVLVGLAFCAYAVVALGDFKVLLATTHGDDGPVVYADYAAHPDRYQKDILAIYAPVQLRATAQNWLPVRLRPILSPERFAWLMAFLQMALLGPAAWLLAYNLSSDRWVAWVYPLWLASTFAWEWNLANYDTSLHLPYPAQLGFSLTLLAFGLALAEKPWPALAVLAVVALFHPVLTLLGGLVLGLTWWRRQQLAVAPMLGLAAALALAVGPALLLASSVEQLGRPEMLEGMRVNQHVSPWNFPQVFWPRCWTLLGFVVLYALAWKDQSEPGRALGTATLVVVVLFAGSHLVGGWLGIPFLLKLIGLRSTQLMVLFGLPVVLAYLGGRLDGSTRERWAALTLLLLLGLFRRGFFWGPLLVLVAERLGWKGLARGVAVGWSSLVIILVLGGLLVDPILFRGALVLMPGLVPTRPVVLLVLLVALAWLVASLPRHTRRLAVVLVGVLALYSAVELGQKSHSPKAVALYQAQTWSAANTPETARFVEFAGTWRNLAHRSTVNPRASVWYLYSGDARLRVFDDAYLRFYGLEDAFRRDTQWSLYLKQMRAFYTLDEAGVKALVDQFGGDYLVHDKTVGPPRLSFPVAYENDAYVIYRVGNPGS